MRRLMEWMKSVLRNGGLFIILLIATYKMIFSKMNFENLLESLGGLNKWYLFFGVLTAIFIIVLEGFVIKRNLGLLQVKKNYGKCFIYALAGNFFSAITPAATGGQPMQVYYMNKDDIPISKGTLALLMDLGAYQFAIVSMGIVGYIAYFHRINASLEVFRWILRVGLIFNIILLVITFMAIFSKGAINGVIHCLTSIIQLFSGEKALKVKKRIDKEISTFRKCAEILKENKKDYIINCAITFIRIIAMHMAPFWIYKSMGLSGEKIFTLIAFQAVLYISCAALPLPGGIGVGESAFLLYFSSIFTKGSIDIAMMMSRSIGFYSIVIFSGIILLARALLLREKGTRKRKVVMYAG